MTTGRIVILNGASSTGKTSIAHAFREQRSAQGEFWLLASVDDVLGRVPGAWLDVGWPDGPGEHADQGLRTVATARGPVLSVGPLLDRLLRLHRRSVVHAAEAGFDVLVDEVVLDASTWHDWADVLDGIDVTWVAVRCEDHEVRRREAARGDRPIGLAAIQATTVHDHATYDLELDTTATSPAANAQLLAAHLGR